MKLERDAKIHFPYPQQVKYFVYRVNDNYQRKSETDQLRRCFDGNFHSTYKSKKKKNQKAYISPHVDVFFGPHLRTGEYSEGILSIVPSPVVAPVLRSDEEQRSHQQRKNEREKQQVKFLSRNVHALSHVSTKIG